MGGISRYREILQNVFREYARLFNQQPEGVDVIAVCDDETDTYSILNVGWDGNQRVNMTSVLMRIVNDKIWVEEDRTMYGFVDELLAAGLSHDDIVLAFQPPEMRHLTQFAVA